MRHAGPLSGFSSSITSIGKQGRPQGSPCIIRNGCVITIDVRGTAGLVKRELWSPESAASFRPDAELLDERPPLLGVRLHARCERLRRLLVARKNLHSEVGE